MKQAPNNLRIYSCFGKIYILDVQMILIKILEIAVEEITFKYLVKIQVNLTNLY